MIHLGSRIFEELSGEVVKTSTFIMRKGTLDQYKAVYCKVDNLDTDHKELAVIKKDNIYIAVSYTHLDVYKRQARNCAVGLAPPAVSG